MISIHRAISYSEAGYIELETLEYAYPISHLRLEYDSGKGAKVHHVFVGYSNGNRFLKSKNHIPKKVQRLIQRDFFSTIFINNLREL